MKKSIVFIVSFLLFSLVVGGLPANAKMVTLMPELGIDPPSSPDNTYWSTEGSLEFQYNSDGFLEMEIIDGSEVELSGQDPFKSGGLYLNYTEGRDVLSVSGSIMIPENPPANDNSLGITLQKWTDLGFMIQMRVVLYSHYSQEDPNSVSTGQLAAQIFVEDPDGSMLEIDFPVYIDANLGTFYNILVQHRGTKVSLFIDDVLVREWELRKKEYGKIRSSMAYFWGFNYDIEHETVGTVKDMIVRFKE